MRKIVSRARTIAALAGCLMAISGTTFAFEDVVTRLRVDPPPPLTAEKIQNINFAGAIGIRSPEGSPQPSSGEFLCQIGFAPQPADTTQEQINTDTLDPAYLEALAPALEGEFESHETATFTANGVAGLEIYATPKDQPDSRLYTTLLQTPVGIVQQHCTTTAADADAALVLFRAIRDTINPP
jgi:hypothetical protein